MTHASRAALRQLAEKSRLAHSIGRSHGWSSTEINDAEAYRVAVEDPDAILALLTALDRAEVVIDSARALCSALDQGFMVTNKVCYVQQAIAAYDAHSRSAGQAGETT